MGIYLLFTYHMTQLTSLFPSFIVGSIVEIVCTIAASVLVAVFTTVVLDRRKNINAVMAQVMNLRLKQYGEIRMFIKNAQNTKSYAQDSENILNLLECCSLKIENDVYFESSDSVSSLEEIDRQLTKLENLTADGLYILDDVTLGQLLTVKIYVKNLRMYADLFEGYIRSISKENEFPEKELKEALDIFYTYLSVFTYNDYQKLISVLSKSVEAKSSKPRFERKEKNYRKIRTRQKIQDEVFENTWLNNNFPNLVHALILIYIDRGLVPDEECEEFAKGMFRYTLKILDRD